MSDVMLLGVLRMPMPDNPADMGGLEWAQVKDRMRQAADEIEKERAAVDGHIRLIEVLEDEVARLRAELAAERERAERLEADIAVQNGILDRKSAEIASLEKVRDRIHDERQAISARHERALIQGAKLREALVKAKTSIEPIASLVAMTPDGFPDHDICPIRLGQARALAGASIAIGNVLDETGGKDE